MQPRVRVLVGLALLGSGSAWSANVYEPCLDYFQAGLSGCQSAPRKPSPTAAVSPTGGAPTVAENGGLTSPTTPVSRTLTLDERIDQFLKDQGKPPREFVAFYLEPTPENALRWAYKFQELQQRNIQITEAWTQAEQLVLAAQARGTDLTRLASETLPPVMPITGPLLDWTNLGGDGLAGTLALPINPGGVQGLTGLGNPLGAAAPSLTVAGLTLPLPPQQPAAPAVPAAAADSFSIVYYFSSACPFCQKFEPEFRAVKDRLGDRLNITCVDVSPPGSDLKVALEGQLGCVVRRPQEGEVARMGLKTTPTLIVRRGNATQLDRINGYVPGDKLETWLLTGRPPT